jgi:hypothetical protein
VWAKALFEGLFGSKDQSSTNIIEDIIEELEKAKQANDQNHYV